MAPSPTGMKTSTEIKAAPNKAGIKLDRCNQCGAGQNMPHPILGILVKLAVFYLDGNTENLTKQNAIPLCQRCAEFAVNKTNQKEPTQ